VPQALALSAPRSHRTEARDYGQLEPQPQPQQQRSPSTDITSSSAKISDLESKLALAHRKVEEAVDKLQREQERARRAEAQLHENRSALPGGSDMQVQLMQDFLQLRNRCTELENMKKSEEAKANNIEKKLAEQNEERAKTIAALTTEENENKEIKRTLEELKLRQKMLEEDAEKKEKLANDHTRNLERIGLERDETLNLLETAIRLKEREKHDGKKKAEEQKREIDRLRVEQQHEQREVRRLLAGVDELLAKIGRGEGSASPDELRELVSIRDGMRQLIKARERQEARHERQDARHERPPTALPKIRE